MDLLAMVLKFVSGLIVRLLGHHVIPRPSALAGSACTLLVGNPVLLILFTLLIFCLFI